MDKKHIKEGEVVNLKKLKEGLDVSKTHALARTEDMEVIRVVIPGGKTVNEHQVDGEIQVQCLQGHIQFNFGDTTRTLKADDWLYLGRKIPHSLVAEEDTVLLLTILFAGQKE